MNRQTSRRTLLQGAVMLTTVPAAAMGAVSTFAVMGEPEPILDETPIVRLFRKWEALLVEHDKNYRAAEAQAEALGTQMDFKWDEEIRALTDLERYRIENAILAEPPITVQDLTIKVLVNSGEGTWAMDDALTLQCTAMAGRDFAKLPRCLFTKDPTALREV